AQPQSHSRPTNPWLLPLRWMSFPFREKAETASEGVDLPWATSANICGIRKVLKISSITGVVLPGWPGFVVYFSAIVARIEYLPLGFCVSCAAGWGGGFEA